MPGDRNVNPVFLQRAVQAKLDCLKVRLAGHVWQVYVLRCMWQLQGVHDGGSSAASAAVANACTPRLTTHTRPDFNHALPL